MLTTTLTAAFNIQPAKTEPATIIVPDDYPTIEEAVNAASSGDTVYVRAGTYYESVEIDKLLSLVGEDRGTTIIDGSDTLRVYTIKGLNVHGVNVTGFSVLGRLDYSFGGIVIGGRNWNVSGNNVANCYRGISLASHGDTLVTGNNVIDCYYGIHLSGSSNNDIARNTVTDNHFGIYASGSDCNRILENTIAGNNITGISLNNGCNMNILSRNRLTDNHYGIYTDSSFQDHRNYNEIIENNITKSIVGITLYYSGYNSIVANDVIANDNGIQLYGSDSCENSLVGNTIANNGRGIWIAFGSKENIIYHNNLINNTNQVDVDANWINIWDNGYPSGGNYWSDYAGIDLNRDGIGDPPHIIDTDNQDNYPLMGKFHSRHITYIEQRFTLTLISNSTISFLDVGFLIEDPEHNEILIFASSETGYGFCRLSIPKDLMAPPYTIIIDNGETAVLYYNETLFDNGTHRWIYFAYEPSTHEIQVIPEFPSALILPLFMILSAIAVVIAKKKHPKKTHA